MNYFFFNCLLKKNHLSDLHKFGASHHYQRVVQQNLNLYQVFYQLYFFIEPDEFITEGKFGEEDRNFPHS